MIHPQLATMLVYLFTDVGATARELQSLLREACDDSLNCMSIDGDTSTNDTVLLLASGASGARLKDAGARKKFSAALTAVCQSLAEQIVSDGEGVQHVIRLFVEQARSREEALLVARTIAHSMLVKTAWAGADPNWGRILAAVGRMRRAHRSITRPDFHWQAESLPQRRCLHLQRAASPPRSGATRSAMFACSSDAARTRCDFSPPI